MKLFEIGFKKIIELFTYINHQTFTFDNPINLFVFIVLFFLFLWSLSRVFYVAKKTQKQIKRGRLYLVDINKNNINEKYKDVNATFLKDNDFKYIWQEFDETLRKITFKGETYYYNTAEASHFINIQTLFKDHFKSSFYYSFPTILTGIGILGTFVGLVSGLQFFEGIDFSDTLLVAEASEGLLSGIGASFITSVWGLFFSILLNLTLSNINSSVEFKIQIFTDRLEAIFPRHISAEGEGLFEIKKELEKHTTALESFSTKVANAVSEALQDGISTSLAPTIEKMAGVLEKFSSEKSDNLANALSGLVHEFRESLTGSAESEMKILSESLKTISSNLDNSNETFNSMISNLQSNIQEQSELSTNQKEFISTINQNITRFDTASNKMSDITERQFKLISDFGSLATEIESIKDIINPLNNSLDKAKEASDKYVETARLMDNSSKHFEEAIQLNHQLLGNQKSTLESVQPIVKEVERIVTSLQQPLSFISSSIEEFRSVESIKVETLENLNSFTQTSSSIIKQLNEHYLNINKVIEEFTSTSESSTNMWNSYKDSFDKIQKEINSGIVDYTNVMRDNASSLFKDYDNALANGLARISTSISDLVDSFESLEDKLDSLNEGDSNV